MTAYIEYVFLENFLLDGLLLIGAHRFTKTRVCPIRTVLSAGLGGIYALLSPFIDLPVFWNWVLKCCVGALLCLCAYGKVNTKKQWGRYAFFLSAFLLFTFVVAGFLLSVWHELPQKPPFLAVLFAVATGIGALEIFVSVHRKKRALYAYIYNCIIVGKTRIKARGYMDSGNVAKKDGLPVCFVSPLLFYEAFSYTTAGEKTRIITVAGEKEILVYKGELYVQTDGKTCAREVYFSPSKHIVLRDYEVVFPACIIEER